MKILVLTDLQVALLKEAVIRKLVQICGLICNLKDESEILEIEKN